MRVLFKAAVLVAMIAPMAVTAAQAAPVDAEHAALARFASHWSVKQSY